MPLLYHERYCSLDIYNYCQILQQVSNYTYLGVIFDDKMSYFSSKVTILGEVYKNVRHITINLA